MSMTAAQILRAAEPPTDDGGIDQALADLDVKIWTWADAMLSAQAAIRRALAHKDLFARGGEYMIATGAVPPAAIPTIPMVATPPPPPPQPSAYTAPAWASGPPPGPAAAPAPPPPIQLAPLVSSPQAAASGWAPTLIGTPLSPSEGQAPEAAAWGQPIPMPGDTSPGAVVWPSAPQNSPAPVVIPPWDGAAPDPSMGSGGGQNTYSWPAGSPDNVWPGNPNAGSSVPSQQSPAAGAAPGRQKKAAAPQISAEDAEARAAKAAEEEAMLAALDEASARRVRLLRRLDPDAEIEHLIEKAKQTQPREAEKTDKPSWWRRKGS